MDMSSPRISYKLEDMDGEEVQGMFVSDQLQKVTDPTNQPLMIEKIVKRRGDQVLVKYLGYGISLTLGSTSPRSRTYKVK